MIGTVHGLVPPARRDRWGPGALLTPWAVTSPETASESGATSMAGTFASSG